jgi:hypothetical protein
MRVLKMNAEGLRAEQIKWWDALDAIGGSAWAEADVEAGVGMARDCQHPDAQWLTSLCLAFVGVTRANVREVMLRQGDDPRALYIAWLLGDRNGVTLLERSARMGYAPAQARMCERRTDVEAFLLAQQAASHGDRHGAFSLGRCYLNGVGCAIDMPRAVEMMRVAAELGYVAAQYWYGRVAFRKRDWERFVWWGKAALRRFLPVSFCTEVQRLLPSFKEQKMGRVLHAVAHALRAGIDVAGSRVFGEALSLELLGDMRRVVRLHDAMLVRARQAILCWSAASRRLGMVKDIRIVIAKMAWEEPWRWGDKEPEPADV